MELVLAFIVGFILAEVIRRASRAVRGPKDGHVHSWALCSVTKVDKKPPYTALYGYCPQFLYICRVTDCQAIKTTVDRDTSWNREVSELLEAKIDHAFVESLKLNKELSSYDWTGV